MNEQPAATNTPPPSPAPEDTSDLKSWERPDELAAAPNVGGTIENPGNTRDRAALHAMQSWLKDLKEPPSNPPSGDGASGNGSAGGNGYDSSTRQRGHKFEAQFVYNDLAGTPYMLKRKWRNPDGGKFFAEITGKMAAGPKAHPTVQSTSTASASFKARRSMWPCTSAKARRTARRSSSLAWSRPRTQMAHSTGAMNIISYLQGARSSSTKTTTTPDAGAPSGFAAAFTASPRICG